MAREFIRDYNRIRPVLEHIYTYGFFSREDFERRGVIKKSGYDKELQRLLSIFPSHILRAKSESKRKYFYIRRDYFSNRAPWLVASYYLHSAKAERICLTLLALTHLPSTPSRLLLEAEQMSWASDADVSSTLRRQLRRLEELGYIEKDGSQYRLPPDPLTGLSLKELTALYQLVSLFAYAGFPRTPGEFLRRALQREFFIRNSPPPGDPFLFRDNCCRSIFDEELVCQLASACREHKVLELTKGGKVLRVAPVSVQLDPRMGRWYLECVEWDSGRAMRIRVRLIEKCRQLQEKFQPDRYRQIVQESFAFTYLSTSGHPPVCVEAQLLLAEDSFQLQQFRREIFTGEIIRRGDALFYRAEVRDPLELKPLLRSYYPYLRICPGEHTLDRDIRRELERMLHHYGTLS